MKKNNDLELKFCDFGCVHAEFSKNTPLCYTATPIKCSIKQRDVAKSQICEYYQPKK